MSPPRARMPDAHACPLCPLAPGRLHGLLCVTVGGPFATHARASGASTRSNATVPIHHFGFAQVQRARVSGIELWPLRGHVLPSPLTRPVWSGRFAPARHQPPASQRRRLHCTRRTGQTAIRSAPSVGPVRQRTRRLTHHLSDRSTPLRSAPARPLALSPLLHSAAFKRRGNWRDSQDNSCAPTSSPLARSGFADQPDLASPRIPV